MNPGAYQVRDGAFRRRGDVALSLQGSKGPHVDSAMAGSLSL